MALTSDEKSTMLKAITGETDADTISAYLSLAEHEVIRRSYPYGDGTEAMPTQYDHLQVEIAVYMLNKRGGEGETSHSENGVSRQYENGGIPYSLARQIIPYASVIGSSSSETDGDGS